MDNSQEYSRDEIQEIFLRQVKSMVSFWANNKSVETTRERLDGLAFSIMSIIDGSGSIPAFSLSPSPAEEDKEYHLSRGEKYFPQDSDISGELHELYYKI